MEIRARPRYVLPSGEITWAPKPVIVHRVRLACCFIVMFIFLFDELLRA